MGRDAGKDLEQQSFASKKALLRWRIVRNAFVRHRFPISDDDQDLMKIKGISRKVSGGFNLIQFHQVDTMDFEKNSTSAHEDAYNNSSRDICNRYLLPIPNNPELFLMQRADNYIDINDFEICKKYDIDNTGLVCKWPTEEVLAHFCITHADSFRGKRIIELGSGYGLAGFATAVATEATEVVISDGNPLVVNYIELNIKTNHKAFGNTKVSPLLLHWNGDTPEDLGVFDIVIASDCTFFKECHKGLVQIIKKLIGIRGGEAMIFGPRRGDSMERFLNEVGDSGLNYVVKEKYDPVVWSTHERCLNGGGGNPCWLNYEVDHCYPLFVKLTLQPEEEN